jgi:phosphoenolpyruvate-protein phosphotransferase (PTS system enzyme I)
MQFQGIAAAPGYAIGTVWHYKDQIFTARSDVDTMPFNQTEEQARLHAAISTSKQQIEELAQRLGAKVGVHEVAILDSQLVLLKDPEIVEAALALITEQSMTAFSAIAQVVAETTELFRSLDDKLLQERASDVEDIGKRILANLTRSSAAPEPPIPENCIVVARDLTPSDTASLDTVRTKAFATNSGGSTSHSAILARAMGIVAVVGLGDFAAKAINGDTIIVDGLTGLVFLNPDATTLAHYKQLQIKWVTEQTELQQQALQPSYTTQGKRVLVAANIGSLADAERSLENGAEGVGLFRTEFLFLERSTAPSEDEQFAVYKAVLEKMIDKPVIIRTLDIGGDKEVPYLVMPKEDNPFLGLRAVRLCLQHKDLFKAQLRALLRASVFGMLKIMFPMISSLSELRAAKQILAECSTELKAEEQPQSAHIELGIMIEIPSAALIADDLIKECDFFSIGSNDLTQYTLAVDRMNESVADLYCTDHPAVLRLIKMTIDAAHAAGKHCGMCGEFAGDPKVIPLLLDYGLDEFSMGASSIPKAKQIIRAY